MVGLYNLSCSVYHLGWVGMEGYFLGMIHLLGPVDSEVCPTSTANQHRNFTPWSKGKLATLTFGQRSTVSGAVFYMVVSSSPL